MGGSGWRPGLGGWEVGEMWEMTLGKRGKSGDSEG